ncbi:MAG TPA: hypothetical protein VHM20_05645, partial [Gammaproteobacteria bacterium]|nr:hypothetical protein [Gammaproteobacteria bacterium]
MHGIIQSKRAVYWVAGLISLFISLWIFKQTELINPDGICYVESAANMPKGLHYAMHLCGQAGWPFYSILIYGMHLLTHFTMENSAYLLDALLSLLSVLTFIRIVEVLALQKQNHFILWLAAFVILFSNIFNDVRHYIIRDHGYFAFYLLAILFLLNFFQIRKWFYALGWSVASIIATFFRIEGAIFLALIPLIAFFDWRTSFVIRIQSFFKLNLLSIIGVCFVAVLLWFHPEESLGRFREINLQQASMFLTVLQTKSELLKTYILNKHAMIDPKIILFFTLLVWYLYSAISNVSWIYMILVVYAWSKKLLKMPPIMNMVIWSYLIINVALTFLFLSTNMFISKRYLVGQSLVLMLWVPFALQALFLQWRTRKLCVMLVLILLVISAASGLIEFG